MVQLPGLSDVSRARAVIGQTARLEFRLVTAGPEVNNLVERLDRVAQGLPPTKTAADTTASAASDSTDVTDLAGSGSLRTMLGPFNPNFDAFLVRAADMDKVEEILAREEIVRLLSRDFQFLWSSESLPLQDGSQARMLYAVDKAIQLAGNEIENAVPTPDPDRPPKLMVSLTLDRRGGLKFANVTGANVGRKLAIVLDGKVKSAPVIRGKIPGGRASISGGFEVDSEAQDLALMLRAGALPADVVIAEERTVGPSLGADSIRQGVRSTLVGGVVVILFMIIYYKVAGLLATGGLIVTVMFLLGILAQLGLTLTLPGIAGIILTVGMAVDANVLIFERIREELRNKKSVRAAIDSGYAQATRAIVDANITTFIAAVVLFYFGTGPIKGFAVTLSIGIVTSMFSALVFTRSIYELWLGDRAPKSLSI